MRNVRGNGLLGMWNTNERSWNRTKPGPSLLHLSSDYITANCDNVPDGGYSTRLRGLYGAVPPDRIHMVFSLAALKDHFNFRKSLLHRVSSCPYDVNRGCIAGRLLNGWAVVAI